MFFLQMSGFPGSGKSTLARLIARETGAIVIDHDIVKSALLESLKTGEMDTRDAGTISYHIEWSLIDFHLSQGHSVILDSPCFYTEMIDRGIGLSEKHGANYKYIECYLNHFEETNKRLKTRKRMISQVQQVDSEEDYQRAIQNSKRPENVRHLVVDSSQPISDYTAEVLAYVTKES